MLDSIYHMTLKLLKNHIFSVKTSRFCHLLLFECADSTRAFAGQISHTCLNMAFLAFIHINRDRNA